MSGMPAGWRQLAVRDVCVPVAKVDPADLKRSHFQYVDIGSIAGGATEVSTPQQVPVADAPARARQLVAVGDTVFSTVRPYLKKIAWIPNSLDGEIASTGFCVLRPKKDVVDPRFLFHFATSDSLLDQVLPLQRGVSYPAIRDGDVFAAQIALPPLDEQRRIVNILEDHLSRLDDAGRSIHRATELGQQMLLSHLVRATTPQRHWVSRRLGDLAISVRNGIFVSRPSAEATGVPILRIGAVRSLHLDLSDLRYTARQVADFDAATQLLSAGDLLFTRYNGNPDYVAACAEVPSLGYDITYPDKLIRVRLRAEVADPSFVAMACSVGPTRTFLRSKVKTTAGQAGISGSDVKAAPILLPPLDEQRALAEAFREFRAEQESTLVSVSKAQQMTGGFRRSLLRVAFSGGLNDTREVRTDV